MESICVPSVPVSTKTTLLSSHVPSLFKYTFMCIDIEYLYALERCTDKGLSLSTSRATRVVYVYVFIGISLYIRSRSSSVGGLRCSVTPASLPQVNVTAALISVTPHRRETRVMTPFTSNSACALLLGSSRTADMSDKLANPERGTVT